MNFYANHPGALDDDDDDDVCEHLAGLHCHSLCLIRQEENLFAARRRA